MVTWVTGRAPAAAVMALVPVEAVPATVTATLRIQAMAVAILAGLALGLAMVAATTVLGRAAVGMRAMAAPD